MSDYFPTELLIEILLKLPVKSLIRFTIVCKSWHSLITSPTFISSHLSYNKNHALLLRRYDKHDKREHYSLLKVTKNGPFGVNSSSELEFPFKSQIGYFRIVGSCDGLVCLSDDFFANSWQPVILWNPSVRNHIVLPKTIINPKEPHIFVLGFGVASHVYKIVRLVYCRKPDDFGFSVPPQVEIFSLKTGTWRRVRRVNFRLRILEFMWCQAFLNGVVHWLAYEPINDNSSRSSILAFQVGDEIFREVMLPDELAREAVTTMCIFVIEESLGVIKYDGEAGNESCDVWMMEECGVKESWTKLYRIDLFEGIEKVVAFWKSGEALLALQGLELVAYNPDTRQTNDLGIYGTTRSFYIDYYVESLLLLRGHSGAVGKELGGDALEGLSPDGCCIV
ncbi:hypothetical protein Pfo_013908 [Paulownia fortunei]|nr:hypothetical protein Pfo_013908 [Paulownia fortunei]